jgi:hypothetical protein
MNRALKFYGSPFVVALLLAASLVRADETTGVLEVRIKDHREAIGDFSRLVLKLDTIEIRPDPGLFFWQEDWRIFNPSIEEIDLTKYVGARSAGIFQGAVGAGSFEAIHLRLKQVEGILKKDRRAVSVKNLVGPITLPFTVQGERETRIVLDLVVLDMKDHPPRGYELGIQGYELYTNGKLVDKIPPGL